MKLLHVARRSAYHLRARIFTRLVGLLNDYVGINHRESYEVSGISAVNGLILGLRWSYYENGHKTRWNVDHLPDGSVHASGNPCERNPDIAAFKKMVAQKLAEIG